MGFSIFSVRVVRVLSHTEYLSHPRFREFYSNHVLIASRQSLTVCALLSGRSKSYALTDHRHWCSTRSPCTRLPSLVLFILRCREDWCGYPNSWRRQSGFGGCCKTASTRAFYSGMSFALVSGVGGLMFWQEVGKMLG